MTNDTTTTKIMKRVRRAYRKATRKSKCTNLVIAYNVVPLYNPITCEYRKPNDGEIESWDIQIHKDKVVSDHFFIRASYENIHDMATYIIT